MLNCRGCMWMNAHGLVKSILEHEHAILCKLLRGQVMELRLFWKTTILLGQGLLHFHCRWENAAKWHEAHQRSGPFCGKLCTLGRVVFRRFRSWHGPGTGIGSRLHAGAWRQLHAG